MSLSQRVVTSTSWNLVANAVTVIVQLVRAILLARWLPVETFGIYSFAVAIVNLSVVFVSFGMRPAFLYRAPETRDEGQTAAVHFTLKLIFISIWFTLLIIGVLLFTNGPVRISLLILTLTTAGIELTETPKLILARRVVHRRIALIALANVLLGTLFALSLAWFGATLEALLATDLVNLVTSSVILYLWRPVWRPRITWKPAIMRYFLHFGSRVSLINLFAAALDRLDDMWTGIYLGKTSLGFYSRAYAFARYPRTIVSTPIDTVAAGAYAELKNDRQRLSRAFFQINMLLIRSGFFLGGLLALIAPEAIRLVVGDKWLPMLVAFRLMLLYTLLDPIQKTVSKVFTAVGKPEQLVKVRFVQLIVLGVALFVLGSWLGIAGVALSVDLMLIVGMMILFRKVKTYVDVSLWELFAIPSLALILGMMSAGGVLILFGGLKSDWYTMLIKFMVFLLVYSTTLFALEKRQSLEIFSFITSRIFGKADRKF